MRLGFGATLRSALTCANATVNTNVEPRESVNCVEVATRMLCDYNSLTRPALAFSTDAWSGFMADGTSAG
jgi:hypothetical protein